MVCGCFLEGECSKLLAPICSPDMLSLSEEMREEGIIWYF